MIAQPLPYEPEAPPRRGGVRSARTATHERRKRTARMRYRAPIRVVACVGSLTMLVVIYLGLMANVTRLNYERERASVHSARLEDEASRLDDTIARLTSRDRLMKIANQLHFRQPSTFVSIELPAPPAPVRSSGLAFLARFR